MNQCTVRPNTLRGCTNFKLRQLMRRVAQHYDAELGQAGLKTTQYSLLTHVLKLGPLRPSDLAQAIKMDSSTLTRNLKPLIEAGWVTLSAGADGRSRSVAITDTGKAKQQQARQYWKKAQQSLNQKLGHERVLALHTLIDDSLDLLSTSPSDTFST